MRNNKNANAVHGLSDADGEATWAHEVNGLRKLALKLWHELQIMESMHCMEVNGRIDLNEEVTRFETALIRRALLQTGGHQSESARLLGISQSSLNAKIKRYGIKVRDPQAFDHIGLAEPADFHL